MKKILLIILIALLSLVVFTCIAWISNIQTKANDNASLEISSLGGNMQIYIDEVNKAEIKQAQTKLDLFNLSAGIHKVKLVRNDTSTPYFEYETNVNLVNNLSSSISYELGPTANSTQGWILDYIPKTTSDNLLYIYTSEDAKVQVVESSSKVELPQISMQNGYFYKISLDKNYSITISKPNYIIQSFSILANSNSTELKNYDMVVRSKLFSIPVLLEK